MRNAGFTIVEILIAMVVLSLGLLGILSVFPAGIRQTAAIVEDSNAAVIAESVFAAINLGLHRARIDVGANKGFIYLGEGVEALMKEKEEYLPIDITTLDGNDIRIEKKADCWVRLPFGEKATYLYPRPNTWEYEMGAPTSKGFPPFRRVFPCGAQIAADATNPRLTVSERKEAEKDPFPQYSYAFTIREARVGDPPAVKPDHSLYELTIYIYKNFPTNLFKMGNESAAFSHPRHQPVKVFRRLITY